MEHRVCLSAVAAAGCPGDSFRIFVLPSPFETFGALYGTQLSAVAARFAMLETTLAGFGWPVFGRRRAFGGLVPARVYGRAFSVCSSLSTACRSRAVPILVIWFGFGALPAMITSFLLSFFPGLVSVATGFATVEPELLDVLRVLGATRRDMIVKIGIPRSLPYFFASLKIAITLSFVGTGDRRDHRRQLRDRQRDARRQLRISTCRWCSWR